MICPVTGTRCESTGCTVYIDGRCGMLTTTPARADSAETPEDALTKLADVHRGWCNYCRGDKAACYDLGDKHNVLCSMRGLEDALRASHDARVGATTLARELAAAVIAGTATVRHAEEVIDALTARPSDAEGGEETR